MKSQLLPTTLAALALALPIFSCAKVATPDDFNQQGEIALQELDYDAAKANFEGALAVLAQDSTSPDYLQAKLGLIESLVYLDPDSCAAEFTSLATELPGGGPPLKDYVYIAGLLANAGHLESGFAVADLGNQRFPDAPGLVKVFENIAEKAKNVGSSKLNEGLAGLGYLE
ncbi:MAG: hypothetical protein ACI84E_000230 [Planctomycetota bacterium]|jgi:hypothetical protein